MGRVAERWRYDYEDAIHAREHALTQPETTDPELGKSLLRRFPEIPKDLMEPRGWTTVQSRS